ncbi:DUF3397 domain-containing protein [Bacillus sp. 03113]|uniref:DUF3397 domain-containing protein n=1 Tax=Bacillus sp. 03113 TaxID=2578211 RepID=UPI0011412E9A|nr:DUF3397 domain-containing protein [Bacillus sp. 03113]
MLSVLSAFVATIVTVPILGYLFIFIVCKQVTKNHRLSVKVSVDATTILFIISVHFLIVAIWNKSFLWLIILFMLTIAIIMVIIHWKVKHEINFPQVFRGIWRINFIVFFTAYVILLFYGLIYRITILLAQT